MPLAPLPFQELTTTLVSGNYGDPMRFPQTLSPRRLLALILFSPCLLLLTSCAVGTWRVDLEKTLQANRTAPARFTRDYPRSNWEQHLRGEYAGVEYRLSPKLIKGFWDPNRFDGTFVRMERGSDYAQGEGGWKRLGHGQYEMYYWLSGPAYAPPEILHVHGSEAVWVGRRYGTKAYLKR